MNFVGKKVFTKILPKSLKDPKEIILPLLGILFD
jgi:hypothetical protein